MDSLMPSPVTASPLSVVRARDGTLRLECEGKRMSHAQVIIQSGGGLADIAVINIPLRHIELLTERDLPLQ